MVDKITIKKVGTAHKRILIGVRKILKPGASFLEIFEYVNNKIKDFGFKPAFPVNISVNNIAAHDTPRIGDKRTIKEGDVVKIDIGIHYDGWITDGAVTIEINDTKYKDLIKSSEEALKNAMKVIKNKKDQTNLSEIGDTIERTIKSFGYNPIYNLTGHKIDRYILHAGLSIPNFNNNSQKNIGKGIFAIEPFSSTGKGYVKEGEPSTIYRLQTDKLKFIRVPTIRKIVDKIYNEFFTLPFSKLQLYNLLTNYNNLDFIINTLKRYGILYEYPILVEVSEGIVAQSETTILIYDTVEDVIGLYVIDD